MFFFAKGYKDEVQGFILAAFSTIHKFTAYLKMWEYQYLKNNNLELPPVTYSELKKNKKNQLRNTSNVRRLLHNMSLPYNWGYLPDVSGCGTCNNTLIIQNSIIKKESVNIQTNDLLNFPP